MTAVTRYRVVDADTLRPVRGSWFSRQTVLHGLYERILQHPDRDFKVVDEAGDFVPASHIKEGTR